MRWPWQKDPERERIYKKADAASVSMTRSAQRLEAVTKRIERLLDVAAERNTGEQHTR